MNDKIKFSIEDMTRFVDDEDMELAIAHVNLLSTRPNAHKINITEDILKSDAQTILGKFLVAKMNFMGTDAEGHETDEVIMGYFPKDQEIKFEKQGKYLVASADCIVSKLYATNFYDMFKKNNYKDVSVEMTTINQVELPNGTKDIDGFNLTGATVLGDKINPACQDANMSIIRFSEDEANKFYHNQHDNISQLKHFSEERRKLMAENKTYKINKTELKDTPWGNVDKTELRNKILGAKNKDALVNAVYALVEDGWEDAPSEYLKYPLMEEVDGTFYYNRGALVSALGYAKKENETEVIAKVEKLYKKFKLEEGEEKKMAEEKFAIEGREAWGDVIKQVEDHEGGHVYVDSIEKNKIIYTTKDGVRYDVEADVKAGEDDKTVDAKIDWKTKKKSEDQADIHKFECDDDPEKMSSDANVDSTAYAEMLEIEAKRNKELAEKLEEKDNVIMGYEKELEDLRKFKADTEEKEKMSVVNETLAKVKDHVEEEKYADFEKTGMECKFADVTAWKNGVLATLADNILQFSANNDSHMRMELPKSQEHKSLWDRI